METLWWVTVTAVNLAAPPWLGTPHGELLGVFALIGLVAGTAICAWLLFPGAPLNPDAD